MTIETETSSSFHIEHYNSDHEWIPTGDGPMTFLARESPQVLPESVWVAYVDYMNAREKYAPNPGGYRLVKWKSSRSKEIVHV